MLKSSSSFFCIYLPVFAIFMQALLELLPNDKALLSSYSENGLCEIAQAIIISAALLFSCYVLAFKKLGSFLHRAWFSVAALGCFYVAGEEISWGQHILDWSTPEYWSNINDQQETNLHNTSSWLDQKPRLVLLFGIIFGTLIYPILKKRHILNLPSRLHFLFPPKELSVVAVIVIGTQIIEKLFEAFGVSLFTRYSEIQETYMYYFVLLYLVLLFVKITQSPNKPAHAQ